MNSSPLNDDLVAAAVRGDPGAFRAVYEALAGPVLGYLTARGVPEPEELTSEVFIALFRRISTVTGGSEGLRKLAFSIAHARMVDYYRALDRRGVHVAYDPAFDTRSVPSVEDDVVARTPERAVLDVLNELPEDQREVLTLRFVADLSLEQVAAVIGRSEGAVKQLQRRALVSVRDALRIRGVTQ